MPDITLQMATDVVEKAVQFEAWSWDDPNSTTDELMIETANGLIDAASQASKNSSVAPAVLEILHAAGIEPLSEPSKEAYTQRFGGASTNGHAPSAEDVSAMAKASAPPTTEPQPSASSEPADSPAPAAGDISDIFPGYDDLKAADIKKAVLDSAASGYLSPEEWERIHAYEEANEDRKTIRQLQPEFKAPEPEPALQPTAPSGFGGFTTTTTPASFPSTEIGSGSGPASAADIQNMVAFYQGQSPSRAQQENLPLPAEVDFGQNPPVLPIDITTVSDQELSRDATRFHSCFARAQWLQSQEEGRERAAEHLEREAERDAYVQAYELHKAEIPEEKRTQPTALEAARKAAERDAETAQAVREYRSRKVRHGIDARELRALGTGYDKAVWRVNEELERRARLATSRPS